MKKPNQSFFSTPKSPASLLRWTGLILVVLLLVTGCSTQPPAATQSAPTAVESAAPAVTEQPPAATSAPTATQAPSPSATPTSLPPTDSAAPSSTMEATSEPEATTADTVVPTEATVAATQPAANAVTFQIKNNTDRTILVYGYGLDKSIPSGMTVYFQAPAWGAISLRVCHKNKDNSAGGCYIYNGTISEGNPVIVITK